MKLYKISLFAVAGLMATACNDIDDIAPQGQYLSTEQVQESNLLAPSRAEATFAGMFSMMGQPDYLAGRDRADDFAFIMSAISLDAEGPDFVMPNSGYNWFSVACDYESRNANYWNPYLRYLAPYTQLKIANDIISSFPADTQDSIAINKMAQCRAIRAFDYLALAPYFQYNYQIAKDKPCVPIVTPQTEDFTQNPRATVEEVFKFIMDDLNYAVENLDSNRTEKTRINQTVALGLRARANLIMGNWEAAAADAKKAIDQAAAQGIVPASIEDVSTPAFFDIAEKNWVWGIDVTKEMLQGGNKPYMTAASWVSSFSADGYAAACQCYAMINNLLYAKISATDVRKGWWVDENLHSPLLATISWGDVTGDAISTLVIKDSKEAFLPYTNVKFGKGSGIGTDVNDSDFPLMRAEELYLIWIEGMAKGGNEGQARTELEKFVKAYRDPSYTISSSRSLADEIWFQRRIELWGEGFSMSDVMRLQKPVVRFHEGKETNEPEAHKFNMANNDGWLLMRFPQTEMNTNLAIEDNIDGTQPVPGQNGALRDGVTD